MKPGTISCTTRTIRASARSYGLRSSRLSCRQTFARTLSGSPARRTDGVFRELNETLVQIPWIEALRRRQGLQQQGQNKHDLNAAVDRDLKPKPMSASYHSVILPLSDDPWLSDTYLNSTGQIRLGTLLMDLDALAGVVAFKHSGPGVTNVTAAVDRITIKRPLTEVCNLELSGKVTYTGRSSMDVTLQIAKAPTLGSGATDKDIMMVCHFIMVSVDPKTMKATEIPQVKPETEDDHQLFAIGEVSNTKRKERLKASLLKHAPNDEESELIHGIWQKQIQWHDPNDPERKPPNVHLMESTIVQTATIMQPQYRNRHQYQIFGGYLLKQTFELAFCCAASFSHARPTFISLDPSSFKNPVPVGSCLYCTATVVYTDPPLMQGANDVESGPSTATHVQVRVDTKVRDVEHGQAKQTGQFNFTFRVEKDIKVMPKTYSEFMMYLDARRRAGRVTKSLEQGKADDGLKLRATE